MDCKINTHPHAFRALKTGFGILGAWDIARFPASSVPELSLRGDKPFTLFTTFCLKNTQSGALFRQKDVFELGIMDGLLYLIVEDWCMAKFSESHFTRMKPDCWYMLALAYDGSSMGIYLNGERTHTLPCEPLATGGAANSDFVLGDMLDAYFKDFMLFGKALTDDAIRKLASGEALPDEDTIVWFDFDKNGRHDRGPKQLKISTKAFARIVLVHPAREFRFRINGEYGNIERMTGNLLKESKVISFTGGIGITQGEAGYTRLTGMVSLGTPKPLMCKLEGEIVTLWEGTDIEQTGIYQI